jgi:hypothetical protein
MFIETQLICRFRVLDLLLADLRELGADSPVASECGWQPFPLSIHLNPQEHRDLALLLGPRRHAETPPAVALAGQQHDHGRNTSMVIGAVPKSLSPLQQLTCISCYK